ncbi:MAG: 4Fe-4S binding protein [Halothermotrichaceae bacterium]
MRIDKDKCVTCGQCMLYCPVDAMVNKGDYVEINYDECTECYNCKRQEVCPVDALYQEELEWPRTVRSILSDVLSIAEESQISGRGTEEMKTNEVTGRFKEGYAGVAIELGRPIAGTRMYDVEKVAKAVAGTEGLVFEDENPVTSLMVDKSTGEFREDVLNERAISAIIEFLIPRDKLLEVVKKLEDVAEEIETLFSLDVASRIDENNEIPTEKILKEAGYDVYPNGKTNLGLGKPRVI